MRTFLSSSATRCACVGWRTPRSRPSSGSAAAAHAQSVHLATGILARGGRILLVASRYPNHAEPLWNLPGGRQRPNELLAATVRREFHEEVGLEVEVGALRYVSESYDPTANVHFLSIAFDVCSSGEPVVPPGDAHAVRCAWVHPRDLAEKLQVAVVREPLVAHLADPTRRYFGFADAGITISFADDP
jgi:ADP-ribose pyrophosphatase YjhB (NUDIX family)